MLKIIRYIFLQVTYYLGCAIFIILPVIGIHFCNKLFLSEITIDYFILGRIILSFLYLSLNILIIGIFYILTKSIIYKKLMGEEYVAE